jgi:hypothetical protein
MSDGPTTHPRRSIGAQVQEIERLIAEEKRFVRSASGFAAGLRAAEAEEHLLRLVCARDTLLWVQQNEAAIKAALAKPVPTHRHLRRGTLYSIVGEAELQAPSDRRIDEGDILTVYRGEDGKLWARHTEEFRDGRFERIDGEPV